MVSVVINLAQCLADLGFFSVIKNCNNKSPEIQSFLAFHINSTQPDPVRKKKLMEKGRPSNQH